MWIMQYYNAVKLYKFCKEHDIKRVLDLGTGIGVSAAFVALALKEKGVDYHIDSLEQFDKCVDLAKKLIPKELQENITIYKANAVIWEDFNTPYLPYSVFDYIPEEDYDLIINDGPSFWAAGNYLIDLPNGTVTKMLLEGKIKPNTFIVWDGRISMLSLLEKYYSDNFELYLASKPGQDDMNILKRKDNSIKFQDEKLKALLEETTFFNEKKTTFTTNGSTPQIENETIVSGTGETI